MLACLCVLAVAIGFAAEAAAGQPQRGGTLKVGMVSQPSVLDPTHGAWNVGLFAGNLFGMVLETDDKMKVGPGMAESWSADYKNKTYTFTFRKGIKWHDGKPFTMEDVKYSLEELLPKYDNRGMHLQGTKVEIQGESKVLVRPGQWAPGIQIGRLASADWVIYPKHQVEKGDFPKSEYRRAPVGSGPFKFKEWVRGSHVTLERFDAFYRPGKPYLDSMVVRFIEDPSSLLAALTTGDIDFAFRGLPYEAYETLKKNPNLNVIVDYKPNYKVLVGINQKHPILSKVAVRQALNHAINRKDLAAKATTNVCRASERSFAPEFMPENPQLKTYPFDPKKAEELLDKAGYPRKAGGNRFSITLLSRAGEAEEEKVGDLLKDYFQAVGVELNIKKVDFNTSLQLEGNYQYDMTLLKRWILPVYASQNHMTKWIQPGKSMVNVTQYSNAKVDAGYDAWAYTATSEEERTRALLGVEAQLSVDLPEYPLFDTAWMYIWNKRVGNAFVPARNWIQAESFEDAYIIR
jgi:peptide/nickel transport system substrate-binding protein